MHRLAVGHFTQLNTIEIVGFPIVERPHDIHSIVSIKLWRKPENIHNAT
jgi:hypothetical protein